MAALLNRARMTTATTGTGTVTLGSASAGYATFAEAGAVNATVYSYCIEDGADFEIGIGTYTSSGTTFSRDTVTVSKIAGTAGTSKLNLSGSATVFITVRAEDLARPSAFPLFPCTAISGVYGTWLHNSVAGAVLGGAVTADRLYMARLAVSKAHTITEFAMKIGSAGGAAGNVRIGLYEAGTDGLPGDLLFDSGDMSTATNAAFLTAAASVAVRPGVEYWLCASFSAAPGINGAVAANTGIVLGHTANSLSGAQVYAVMYRARTHAALNASEAGQTWTLANVHFPYIFWK